MLVSGKSDGKNDRLLHYACFFNIQDNLPAKDYVL